MGKKIIKFLLRRNTYWKIKFLIILPAIYLIGLFVTFDLLWIYKAFLYRISTMENRGYFIITYGMIEFFFSVIYFGTVYQEIEQYRNELKQLEQ
jgi:hypothetical protein